MRYKLFHKTKFTYQNMVTLSHNITRLKPADTKYQKLLEFNASATPSLHEFSTFKDIFGNSNCHLLIREAHSSLEVITESVVELDDEALEQRLETAQKSTTTYEEALQKMSEFCEEEIESKLFLYPSELIPKASKDIKEYAMRSFTPKRNLFEATVEFMGRVFHEFEFVSGFSDITTPIETIFKHKKGVCQDFAQFCISALRGIGLSAKYISGYIETMPPEGQEKLFGADASHAWFALFIPTVGWVEFDPTNNLVVTNQHITLGSGRDYADISPLKGVVVSSGVSSLSVEVDIRAIN